MATQNIETNQICAQKICWDQFHNWVHCICVVTFDLELGQAMEYVYPLDVKLSEDDKINICYLAFPDSNSSCLGDTQFHIRVKQSGVSMPLSSCHKIYNDNCPVFLQINPNFYFGYVYFRQIKDQNLPRGYFQKSVIIITRLPFISLYMDICALIAPQYFENGPKSIESACHEINRWQHPIPGTALKVPLFGTTIQGQIPNDYSIVNANTNGLTTCNYTMSTFYPSVYDLNMFEALSNVVYHIHTLWELVITAEPLVILAPSPALCSRLVQALIGMIMTFMYNTDYRPYFTIHDSEFKEYMTKTQSPPCVILGVTNPFFGKTLQHWPHIIKLADNDSSNNRYFPNRWNVDITHRNGYSVFLFLYRMIMPLMYNTDYRPYFTIHDSEFKEYMTKTQSPPCVILGVTNPFFGKTLQHWPHIIKLADNDSSNNTVCKQKIKRNNSMSFFDAKAGIYTHYKPFLHKDKCVIKKLLKGIQMKRPSEVQSAILRRHFLELTQSFIIPLERYMATLMPLKKNISPYKNTPHPLPFNQDDFVSSLEQSGPQLTSNVKGNWIGLYKKFFRCPNFSGWYNLRYKSMSKKLKILQLEALSHMNIHEWLQGKEEIEIVDMILKLRSKLEDIKSEDLSLNEIIRIQLQNKLTDVIRMLPDDLRNVIHIS